MSQTQTRRSSQVDLLHGPILKSLLLFALPIMASRVFQQIYNTMDTLIVGYTLGDSSIAAMGACSSIYEMMTGFTFGVGNGLAIVTARCFGRQETDRMKKSVASCIVIGVAVTLVVTILATIFMHPLLRLLKTPAEILEESYSYISILSIFLFVMFAYNLCSGLLRAIGNSFMPLVFLIFSSLVNIVLDLLFIGAFHWGVWAAAVATTISQAVSMILCMIHLMKKGTIYQVELKKLHIDREMLGQIIRYGLPSGVQNSVIGFANVIVQSNINSFGKVAMAAYGAYSKLEGFAFLPVTSFTMALTTFVGQNLGAGLHDRAKKGSRFGIIASVVIAEIIGVTMYLLAPQLVALFSPTPEVVELGTRQMRTTALFFCLLAYSHAIASICRGAGKAFVPMVIMLLFWCVVRIAYITIVMGIVHEIQYIYMAYPITWSLSSIVYFLYYHFSDWVHGFDKKPAKPQET